ncbi:MAG: 4Fe-4S dicluster domain-containing protein [Anaerolineales bacterium]|nr:4Fe-4S dicluster domain-containing protein [Anaerolineales bacterium]
MKSKKKERIVMTEFVPAENQSAEKPRRKGPRGEVKIFATWCKGCNICVVLCPTQVLAMHPSGNYPIVVEPENCTACHFCDTHCPDLAIVVKKMG